jgi:N-acetylmuramic acid 6-phosphate etherase
LKQPRKTTPENLSSLATEQPNRASADLDLKSALEVARIINAEDAKVAAACSVPFPSRARHRLDC